MEVKRRLEKAHKSLSVVRRRVTQSLRGSCMLTRAPAQRERLEKLRDKVIEEVGDALEFGLV